MAACKFLIVQPETPAAPPPVVVIPKDDKSDTYRTAEKFARDRETLAELATAIDNIIAGEMTPAKADAYTAMSTVYDERAKADKEAKDRVERIKLAQDLRNGRGPKAPVQDGATASKDYLEAFDGYLRTGNGRLMEQFAQAVSGDGTQGGSTA